MKKTNHLLVKALSLLLVFCLFLSGCQKAKEKKIQSDSQKETGQENSDEIKIAIATDLHYISDKLTDNGPYFMKLVYNGDGKASQYCTEIVNAFIDQILLDKPDARFSLVI